MWQLIEYEKNHTHIFKDTYVDCKNLVSQVMMFLPVIDLFKWVKNFSQQQNNFINTMITKHVYISKSLP